MLTSSKQKGILCGTAASAVLVSVILRIINYFLFFEKETAYYSSRALPLTADILMYLSAVAIALLALLFFKKENARPTSASIGKVIAAITGALASGFLAINDFIFFMERSKSPEIYASVSRLQKLMLNEKFVFMTFLLAIMTALYFLCTIANVHGIFKIITGACAIVRLLIILASAYFNYEVAINSPDKILFCLALASCLAAISAELKLLCDNGQRAICLISFGSCMILASTSAISSIVAYHAGLLPTELGLYSEYYILLGFAFFSAVEFFSVLYQKEAPQVSENTEKEATAEALDIAESNDTESTDTASTDKKTTEETSAE